MKTKLRSTVAAIVLAVFNLSAATPARLFVVLSQDGQYSSEEHSVIVAFDLDEIGMPTQNESYVSKGIGDSNHGEQEIRLDRLGKYLFLPNNYSSNLSIYPVMADGSLAESEQLLLPTGPEPAFTAENPSGRFFYVGCWGWQG